MTTTRAMSYHLIVVPTPGGDPGIPAGGPREDELPGDGVPGRRSYYGSGQQARLASERSRHRGLMGA